LLGGANRGGSVYKAVRTSRLYEQIVQQIEKSIADGALKPGDQLPPEREMAQQFGVSRTAVREAVKALREKGLVEAYTGRGTFVLNGTSQLMRQSFDCLMKMGEAEDGFRNLAELRSMLEPEIAMLAGERADESDLAAMREAVNVMECATDADEFVEADLDFHLALAEAAANPLILSLIDSIVGLLREQRILIFNVDHARRGQEHHQRILAAVEKHDPEQARKAMRAHLEQIREDSHTASKINN